MSQGVRSARFLIVAMLGCAGLVFADTGAPVKQVVPGAKLAKQLADNDQDATKSSGENSAAPAHAAFFAPPANDTCAGAEPLTLNLTTKGTTLGANDDYQTPATSGCYAGIGQTPTTAPGRDVVYSFTAPADGKYSFRIIQQSPNDVIRTQDEVLYLTDCANAGTVNCLAGANRPMSSAFVSSTGASNNQSEEIHCYPMTSGQTVFVVFDDGSPGKCSDNNHACFEDAHCAPGATCVPSLNAGGAMSLEPIVCNEEVEPNDSPAEATPYVCGTVGVSPAGATAHCQLGTRAGNVCTRSGFLEQTLPNSNMRCSISNAMCAVDVATGTDNCGAGNGFCQQQTDLDCDPRCDIGPNAGKACTTQAFCNPVSDQGATCAGTCQADSHCIVTLTNVDTGVACTPVCVGSSIPAVNGRYCSSLSGCPGGGVCTTTPTIPTPGATCNAGETCSRVYNEGDLDFFSLGAVPAGSAIFAGLDAKTANDYDWRMRITSDTETLQFDDDDVTSRGGANAPCIAGAVADGNPAYIKVSRTAARESATYELYAHIRPPLASAQLEDESGPTGNDNYYLWPGDLLNCNAVSAGGYVRGTFAYNMDTDCFKFLVNKGDLMDWFGAANPQRAAGSVSLVDIPQPLVYDAEPAGISNFGFGANARKNTTPNVVQPSLHALSPAVTSSYFQWRASYTGMYEVCFFAASQFLSQGAPAYPNNWSGSMTVNCGPVQDAGPGTTTADVSVTKTGPAGPVTTGEFIDFTITITNKGTEIAQEVALDDTLDPNLTFISLTVDDTLGGNNVACYSLPSAGANDAPIYCINASMAPGSTTTYVLTVQVNNCIGDGVVIDNTANITTVSTDPDPGNDSVTASVTTVAAANNGCTDIVCSGGTCIPELCTNNDHCDAGVCVVDAVVCDDNSLCTDDSCDSAVGCVFDSSQAGDLCDDFTQCTADTCDPLLFCVFPPLPSGTGCDDGLTCTVSDQCDGTGICAGTSPCDDANACTDDFADEVNACACSHSPTTAGTVCDDNDACTGTIAAQDACDGAGACAGGSPVVCDDGDACNGTETCDPATGCAAGTPPVCDDGSVCTTDSCDPAQGCVNTPIVCDDGSACTTDSCDPVTGCVYTPVTCDDGSVCTTDSCDPATGCVYAPISCGDGNACTSDGCDPATGCFYSPVTCDDGNACTTDSCDPSTGCVTTPVTCDDGSACTTDSCDPATGCVTTAVTCDDGNACTTDGCDPATGCVTTPVICNDGNACTTDSCDPATGCGTTPVICDDGSACTTDSCDPSTGCVTTPVVCDDGNACTTDGCDPATGCGTTPLICNDGNACTADSCDPATGCVATPVACDDGNACTTDSCNPATGCVTTPVTCDDGNACNGVETCNPASGCAAGTALVCNDGNACNGVETCNPASGCVAGTAPVCDDGNACNGVETCNPASGCVAGTAPVCNDGNACNGVETCNPASGCVAGTALVCNDGNACNGVETCNPASGCVAGTALACNDGDACNGVETCNPASGCVAGSPVVCSASDQCHAVGTCDTVTGVCSDPVKPAGTACDDGDFCTTTDACDNAGACAGGTPLSCPSDAAVCTAEVCDPTVGCVHSDINLDASNYSDTRVDGLDLAVLAAAWNSCPTDAERYNPAANFDRQTTLPDVCIGPTDFHLFMNAFGRSCQ